MSLAVSLAKRRPIVSNCTTYELQCPLAPNSFSSSSCPSSSSITALSLYNPPSISVSTFPNSLLSQPATTLVETARTARWPRCTWGRPSWCSSGSATPAPPSSRCTSPTSSSTRTTPPSSSSGSPTSGMSLSFKFKYDIILSNARGIIEGLFLLAL